MSKVINAVEKDFAEVVLKSKEPVLVDFWAPWCGPCRMMAPILDELSDELDSKLKIVKVDVENPESGMLQHQYEIRGIPNMKLFKKGKVVHEIIGFRNKDILEQELKEFIGK